MRKHQGAFDRRISLQTSGSRAGEPGASLARKGKRRKRIRSLSNVTTSVHAKAGRGPVALSSGD